MNPNAANAGGRKIRRYQGFAGFTLGALALTSSELCYIGVNPFFSDALIVSG